MAVQDRFIVELRNCGLVATAARRAGTSTAEIRRLRSEDPDFDEQVEETLDLFMDVAEQEAFRRAIEGVEKPVFYKGGLVDTVTEYSDALLTKILTSRRPEVYGNKQEITTNTPIMIKIAEFEPPEDMGFLE